MAHITITRFTGSAPIWDPTLQLTTPTPHTVIGAAIPPPDPTGAPSLTGRATFQSEIDTFSEAEAIKGILAQRLNFSILPLHLRENKKLALAAVSRNGRALKYASTNLQNDREVVLTAVSQYGCALLDASNTLKNDREVVLAAVSNAAMALLFAGSKLQNDREVVLAAISEDGNALVHASANLKNDREVVLAAVSQNGYALWFANIALKDDRAVVLAAVSQYGQALMHASANLKNDREVVLAAVSQDGQALTHASNTLRKDRAVVLAAVSQNGYALQYASEDLKNDVEVAAAAVAQNLLARQYVPESILKRAPAEIATNLAFLPFVDSNLITYEIAQKAAQLNYRLLRFVPPEILANRPKNIEQHDEIISCALNENPEALHFIPWDLLTAEMLSFVIRRHKTNNKAELIRSLVKFTTEMGRKTSAEIRSPHLDLAWPLLEFFENSKEVMLILINKYGLGITDVDSEIKNDPEIIAADAQTLKQSLDRASRHSSIENSLDRPILSC